MDKLTSPVGEQKSPGVRYSTKPVQTTDTNGTVIPVVFILLLNAGGIPVAITQLQNYLAESNKIVGCFTSAARTLGIFFCQMLNYILFDNYDTYQIDNVLDITLNMMQDFFTDYANEIIHDGFKHTTQTIHRCINACTFTMVQLVRKFGDEMHLREEDLISWQKVYNPHKKTTEFCYVANFHSPKGQVKKSLLRDISSDAFNILVSLAFKYTPSIAFAICIQAFAGLRPSEVCYLWQDSSIYGPCITQETDSVGHTIFVINLSTEHVLRSDNVRIGGIKKKRFQQVYPEFGKAFSVAYTWHMENLKTRKFEEKYAPMFINQNGMAMTYKNYDDEFNRLVNKYFVPELLANKDPALRTLGTSIQKRGIDPHLLRHFFTVQLVLRGATAAELMSWRGDSCIDSSLTYLMNKGELHNAAVETSEQFLDTIIMAGRRLTHV